MLAFPVAGEEAGYRRRFRGRLEQFDGRVPEAEEGDFDPLVRDNFALYLCTGQDCLVPLESLVEIEDGDTGVIDAADAHASISSLRMSSAMPASMDDSAPVLSEATPAVMPSRQRPVVGSYIGVFASLRPENQAAARSARSR